MTAVRDLADRVHRRWLEANPFAATMYGIPGYDDLVPDESDEGRQAWRAEAGQFLRETDAIAGGQLTPADAITLDCTREAVTQELEFIDLAPAEYTVTAMQYTGPSAFLAVAARTVLVGPAAAEAYLIRLRRSGGWMDQVSERLRAGADKGRLPVAPLAERAIAWAEGILAAPGASPVLSPQPPPGWPRTAAYTRSGFFGWMRTRGMWWEPARPTCFHVLPASSDRHMPSPCDTLPRTVFSPPPT